MKKCPRKNISWKRALLYVFLVLTAVLMLIPFFWMVLSSLKSESELFALPLKIFPERWRFDNYLTLWNSAPWVTYFLNTLKVTALTILGQVVSCSMAAYGFARLKFKGKNLIFLAFLGSMMIPYQAIMIPKFVIISKLGWADTHISLIVPAIYSAFGILLIYQAFLGIPRSLEEAAKIDGCSHPRIFYEIYFKNSKPGILALVLSVLVGTWNEFLRPLIYINSEELWVLSMGLAKFQGKYMTQWNQVMAGAVLTMLPIILLFLVAQRQFIEGLVMSGIKE